jgi:hypothetical protein
MEGIFDAQKNKFIIKTVEESEEKEIEVEKELTHEELEELLELNMDSINEKMAVINLISRLLHKHPQLIKG